MMTLAPILLLVALMLSWPCFATIFRSETPPALSTSPLTTIASAVSLSVLALAAAGYGVWLAVVLFASAMLSVRVLPALSTRVAVMTSLAALCVYLKLHVSV